MDDSGIDAYPFSTLEKAKDAMKKDVEQWKRDMGNTLLHWTFVEDEEEVDEYSEEYEEPYMGDIISEFDEYIQKHPDATNEEVYEALSGIRESVTRRHHEHGDDGQED